MPEPAIITPKVTTKVCPLCGNTNLALFRGNNQKACDLHTPIHYFSWYLDEGQKNIHGSNRDKTRGESNNV